MNRTTYRALIALAGVAVLIGALRYVSIPFAGFGYSGPPTRVSFYVPIMSWCEADVAEIVGQPSPEVVVNVIRLDALETRYPSARAIAQVTAGGPRMEPALRMVDALDRACLLSFSKEYSGTSPGNALEAFIERGANRSDNDFFLVGVEAASGRVTIYQLPSMGQDSPQAKAP